MNKNALKMNKSIESPLPEMKMIFSFLPDVYVDNGIVFTENNTQKHIIAHAFFEKIKQEATAI